MILTGLALAVPELPDADGLAAFFHACSDAVQEHYATAGGAAIAISGALLAAFLMIRASVIATLQFRRRRCERDRHRQMIDLVGRPLAGSQAVVVDHPERTAYAVPGRHGRIVVSSSSLAALTPSQLQVVIGHEAAHLRYRHSWAIAISDVVSTTTGGLLGTRTARAAIGELVEMHADDAVDSGRRADLADAVLVLVGGARAIGALNAAHEHVVERITRLRVARRPIAVPVRAVAGLVVICTALIPIALAMFPALEAIAQHYCPLV
jgi:hypothetical protein